MTGVNEDITALHGKFDRRLIVTKAAFNQLHRPGWHNRLAGRWLAPLHRSGAFHLGQPTPVGSDSDDTRIGQFNQDPTEGISARLVIRRKDRPSN
jgi:hypothetical protein